MSVIELFRSYTEMDTEDDFIQHLERLVSGDPGDAADSTASIRAAGINRPMARLAHNTDAIMEVLQTIKNTTTSFLSGDGTGTLWWGDGATDPNTLTVVGDLTIRFLSAQDTATTNVISADPFAELGEMNDGNVIYVLLDRDTDGATVTPTIAADWAALQTIANDDNNRFRVHIIAVRTGANLTLWDGTVLAFDTGLRDDGAANSQYANRELVQQDLNTFVVVPDAETTPTIEWNGTALILCDLEIHPPSLPKAIEVAGASHTVADGKAVYLYMTRPVDSGTTYTDTFSVDLLSSLHTSAGSESYSTARDSLFVFAHREGDVMYLYDGTKLPSGVTIDYTSTGGVSSIDVGGNSLRGAVDLIEGDRVTLTPADTGTLNPSLTIEVDLPEVGAVKVHGFDRIECYYSMETGDDVRHSGTPPSEAAYDKFAYRVSPGWVTLGGGSSGFGREKIYELQNKVEHRFPWGEGSAAFNLDTLGAGNATFPGKQWVDGVARSAHCQQAGFWGSGDHKLAIGWPGGLENAGLWMDTWAYIYVHEPCNPNTGVLDSASTVPGFTVSNAIPDPNGEAVIAPWLYNVVDTQPAGSTQSWSWSISPTLVHARVIGTVFMRRVDIHDGDDQSSDYITSTRPIPFTKEGNQVWLKEALPFDGYGHPDWESYMKVGRLPFQWEWECAQGVSDTVTGKGTPPSVAPLKPDGWNVTSNSSAGHRQWDFYSWAPICGEAGSRYGNYPQAYSGSSEWPDSGAGMPFRGSNDTVFSFAGEAPWHNATGLTHKSPILIDSNEGWIQDAQGQPVVGFPDAWGAHNHSQKATGYPGATGAPLTATTVKMQWNVYPVVNSTSDPTIAGSAGPWDGTGPTTGTTGEPDSGPAISAKTPDRSGDAFFWDRKTGGTGNIPTAATSLTTKQVQRSDDYLTQTTQVRSTAPSLVTIEMDIPLSGTYLDPSAWSYGTNWILVGANGIGQDPWLYEDAGGELVYWGWRVESSGTTLTADSNADSWASVRTSALIPHAASGNMFHVSAGGVPIGFTDISSGGAPLHDGTGSRARFSGGGARCGAVSFGFHQIYALQAVFIVGYYEDYTDVAALPYDAMFPGGL